MNEIQPKLSHPVASKWNRLLCEWNEVKADASILTHQYALCVRLETQTYFIDCRPIKIFAKCVVSLFARPVFTLIKTLYHLSLVDIPIQLFTAMSKEQTYREALIKSARSIADIVRTPLYGLALCVSTIAVIILTAFNPENAYSGREFLGELEKRANWGEVRTKWTMAPCFQSFSMTALEDKYSLHLFSDTSYPSIELMDVATANLCRAMVYRRREHFNCFDQLSGTLDPNVAYKSKILEKAV